MPLTIKNVLESRIEKIVTAYARSKHWLAYKFSSPSNRGVPDHIYLRDGVVFFIEFKNRKNSFLEWFSNHHGAQIFFIIWIILFSYDNSPKVKEQAGV